MHCSQVFQPGFVRLNIALSFPENRVIVKSDGKRLNQVLNYQLLTSTSSILELSIVGLCPDSLEFLWIRRLNTQ